MKRVRVNGDEQDAFSKFGKRFMIWRPGERKAIKTKANRRLRRQGRTDIRKEF